MNLKIDLTSFINQPHEKNYFQKIAEQTFQEVGEEKFKNKNIEISLAIVDDEEIKKQNNSLRNKNTTTDVLSIGDYSDNKNIFTELKTEDNIFLGEIILCYEFIKKSAKISGTTIEYELSYVFSHGILHLLGYKHGEEMFSIQEKVSHNRLLDI
ncbi:MAG: rRNA maturation RNase YbeY [Candidatus Moranbacteria bacterium]|nr:rRNA maturation RNase YbeY [Candidatus Moranbacteria bacterium]